MQGGARWRNSKGAGMSNHPLRVWNFCACQQGQKALVMVALNIMTCFFYLAPAYITRSGVRSWCVGRQSLLKHTERRSHRAYDKEGPSPAQRTLTLLCGVTQIRVSEVSRDKCMAGKCGMLRRTLHWVQSAKSTDNTY